MKRNVEFYIENTEHGYYYRDMKHQTEDNKKKISEGNKSYYCTEEGQKRKEDIKKERYNYWTSEEGKEMKKKISEHNKAFYQTEEGKKVHEKALEARRKNGVSQSHREKQSKKMKEFWSTEKGTELKSTMNKGKNNQNYGKGKHYKVTDVVNNKVIFEDACNYDLKEYFGVQSFDASWFVRKDVIYKKQYKIEKV